MHEIICPHCNKAFKIDEAGYANILKQVRDGDFDKQLHERLELAEREKQGAIALAEAKVANALQGDAARKDAEIQALQAQLAAGEVVRKLAVAEALGAVSKERDGLANALDQAHRRCDQGPGKNQGSAAQVSEQFANRQRQGRRSDNQKDHTQQPHDGGQVCGAAGRHDIGCDGVGPAPR